MKLGIAIPCNDISKYKTFIDNWKGLGNTSHDITIYLTHDAHNRIPKDQCVTPPENVKQKIYHHPFIKSELGDDSWIIPHGSSACRSWSIYQAWNDGCEIIICMDDDVLPIGSAKYFIDTHVKNLTSRDNACFFNPLGFDEDTYPRGTPHSCRRQGDPIKMSVGLWEGCLDISAVDRLLNKNIPEVIHDATFRIPFGNLFPMCGMNVAFHRDLAPYMYFGLQGRDWPYDRMDDIWAGYLAKQVCDILGWGIVIGNPHVYHLSNPDPIKDLMKEYPGDIVNDLYARNISNHVMCFDTLAEDLEKAIEDTFPLEYYLDLKHAYDIWFSLYDGK